MPFLSIIIPVYNVEKTLYHTLQTIVEQTFQDFELLLIDDDSTDSSGDICSYFSQQFDHIYYWKQKHLGVSEARNKGIGLATGTFLFFMDSDDELSSSTFFAQLHDFIITAPADMYIYSYTQRFYNSTGEIIGDKDASYKNTIMYTSWKNNPKTFLETFSQSSMFVVWNKIFRKDIIQKYEISFKNQWMEDFRFVLDYLSNSESVCFLPLKGYIFNRFYKNSLSLRVEPTMLEGHISVHRKMLTMFPLNCDSFIARIFAPQYYSDLIKYIQCDIVNLKIKKCLESPLIIKSFNLYVPCSIKDKLMFNFARKGHYKIYRFLRRFTKQ